MTGGTGFVGARLVEMLVERGAQEVRVLDVVPPPETAWRHKRVRYVVGDICSEETVAKFVAGADCVWHNAAAVGPFHPRALYFEVNYQGTLNVIRACRAAGVRKIVMSSSPSTRFDGADVDGLTEAQMPSLPQARYLQTYAETKAMGEKACTDACDAELMTVAVAPHQVYGPRDNLFLPNLLSGGHRPAPRLRPRAQPHLLHARRQLRARPRDRRARAPRRLRRARPVLHHHRRRHPPAPRGVRAPRNSPAQFSAECFARMPSPTRAPFPHPRYLEFWPVLDEAIVAMGFGSIWAKAHLPMWLLWGLAYVCEAISWVLGITLKLNLFNVRVLTMHRWFDVSAAAKDLQYEPVVRSARWADTLAWFKAHWLPYFDKRASAGFAGLEKRAEAKIEAQVKEHRAPSEARKRVDRCGFELRNTRMANSAASARVRRRTRALRSSALLDRAAAEAAAAWFAPAISPVWGN